MNRKKRTAECPMMPLISDKVNCAASESLSPAFDLMQHRPDLSTIIPGIPSQKQHGFPLADDAHAAERPQAVDKNKGDHDISRYVDQCTYSRKS